MTDRNPTPASDVEALREQGLQALQQGLPDLAIRTFERALQHAQDDADLWLGLAYAQVQAGAVEAGLSAVDRCLAAEPRHLRGLILKGDLFDHQGQAQAAASFYGAALKVAPPEGELPESLQRQLQRVRQRAQELQTGFLNAVDAVAHRARGHAGSRADRFCASVDILLGRQAVYLQQPRHYYFPGLASIPFHDRALFPWLAELEAQTDVIRREMEAVRRDPNGFVPYIQPDPSRPVLNQAGLYNNPDWGACFLSKNGQPDPAIIERCPATWAAVNRTPLVQVPGRSPSVLFSRLRPRTHIPAHHGFYNTRLIVHLPLSVPPGCRFRVGAETRTWSEGQAWVFDDTIEHEAWNDSDEERVILLFEVWHPALSPAERQMVTELFAALDAQGHAPPEDNL